MFAFQLTIVTIIKRLQAYCALIQYLYFLILKGLIMNNLKCLIVILLNIIFLAYKTKKY